MIIAGSPFKLMLKFSTSYIPLQVLLDAAVAVVFGHAGEGTGGTAPVTLSAQAAVTHAPTERALPRLIGTQGFVIYRLSYKSL